MSHTTSELKENIQRTAQSLRTLRDEIRVDIHLAGLEARDQWEKLERKFEAAQRFTREATEDSLHALEDVLKNLQEFRKGAAVGDKKKSESKTPAG